MTIEELIELLRDEVIQQEQMIIHSRETQLRHEGAHKLAVGILERLQRKDDNGGERNENCAVPVQGPE